MIEISFRLTDGGFHELIIDKLARFDSLTEMESRGVFLQQDHARTTRLSFTRHEGGGMSKGRTRSCCKRSEAEDVFSRCIL